MLFMVKQDSYQLSTRGVLLVYFFSSSNREKGDTGATGGFRLLRCSGLLYLY